MAKIISIYLTTSETEQMDKLITELNVPPSQVLRIGLQVLSQRLGERLEIEENPKKGTAEEKPKKPKKKASEDPLAWIFSDLENAEKETEESE